MELPSATPAPAPFPSPTPVPYSATDSQASYPTPVPAPISYHNQQPVDSFEEEASETETSWDNNQHSTPAPAPAASYPQPQDTPMKSVAPATDEDTAQQAEEKDSQDMIEVPTNADHHNEALKAAADLIHTLDTAYSEANLANATTALEADEARSAARTAAEIVRRYTTRSHPREGSTLSFQSRESPAEQYKSSRSPMITVQTTTPTTSSNSVAFAPSASSNNRNGQTSDASSSHYPRYFPKTPPSASGRIAHPHGEDNLTLSLELERSKQALEAEKISHDETKNLLTEEKTRNNLLQQKLQRLEANMETQRETLGRSGDALEEELQRAIVRMEAAEEDAQLALDFAKESQESREQLEEMLDQAMAEIELLKEQVANSNFYAVGGAETPYKSIMKHIPEDSEQETDENTPKRSVHFSDPISFSNSPSRERDNPEEVHFPNEDNIESPSSLSNHRGSRSMVSAGKKLLQQSMMGKRNTGHPMSTTEALTPEKFAERRQKLRNQLKELGSDVTIPSPESPASRDSSPSKKRNKYTGKGLLDIYQKAAEILQLSGKRLELEGHWWTDDEAPNNSSSKDNVPLDTLARQYCQSIEVKISRQKNDISELESLCSFLEESVASGNTNGIADNGTTENDWGESWT